MRQSDIVLGEERALEICHCELCRRNDSVSFLRGNKVSTRQSRKDKKCEKV